MTIDNKKIKYPYISNNLFYLNKKSRGRKINKKIIQKYPSLFKGKKYKKLKDKYLNINKDTYKNKKIKKNKKTNKKIVQKGGVSPPSADGDIGSLVNDIIGLIYYTGESIVNGVDLVWNIVELPANLGTAYESPVGTNEPSIAHSLV